MSLWLATAVSGCLLCNVACNEQPGATGVATQPSVVNPAPTGGAMRNVIAPPAKGIYLGQTTFNRGEVGDLEQIIGQNVTMVGDYSLTRGTEQAGAPLQFDLQRANAYAKRGYAVITGAYEAHPGHRGFTVDRLLSGEFDRQLSDLAAQYRQFRGNLIFCTCREPNGVLREYFGGFGPNGDRELDWAIETRGGFADFRPPAPPKGAPRLYDGLGRNDVADGIERLGAAQRYYYDFFVRREGLTNLTFETMGWQSPSPILNRRFRNEHERRLEESLTIEQLLAAIGPYYDWVSVNWYLDTEPQDETGFPPREGPQRHSQAFQETLAKIARVAPNRPVLLTEFGVLEPYRDEKARAALDLFSKNPQVKGVVIWGARTQGNPFDCALSPSEPAARTLRNAVNRNADLLQSTIQTQR